ncbi:MAG: riboflavin biosynthesis protein RibF [Gammaproteobacteria bacterium]
MRVHGVDRVLCLRFNEKLAALSAEDFVNQVLHQGLGIKHLVVGDDFRFGARRRGDFAMLQRMGAVLGFDVESMQTVMMDGERVSSTRIRSALMQGELDQVRHLTGRHYAIVGRVIHGDKLGRTIGFPTVNIRLHRRVAPIEGIYAVRISGERIGMHDGVAYSGRRPTVSGEDHRLEVFIFDFDGDVYGQRLKVELLSFLRPDKKFDSLDELKSQIAEDVDNARQYLADRVV